MKKKKKFGSYERYEIFDFVTAKTYMKFMKKEIKIIYK